MEKSLSNIEKSMNQQKSNGSGKGAAAAGALSGLAGNLQAIVASTSIKSFDSKKAGEIISFSRELVKVVNDVKPSSAKAFGAFADGMSKAFETIFDMMDPVKIAKLYLASKILFEGKTPLLQKIVLGMSNAFKDIDSIQAKAGGKALKEMGEGLLSLTKALKSFILIGIAAPVILMGALVVRGIISLFSSFGEKAKEIGEGGKALKELGKGLISFSAGIASIALVTIIAGKEAIAGIGLIALFGLTFYTIGKVADSIKAGARAVAYMGLALFGFSAGLATYMLVMLLVPPIAILQGITTIAGFGLVFALLGLDKVSQVIARGALLLIGMAVALFLFSGGLMVYAMAIKMYDPESLLLGAALIAELGVAMAILGKFEKWIRPGAVTMVEMGIGLGIFSVGLLAFGLAIKVYNFDSVALGATIIAAFGIATSIVGSLEGAVITGAAGLAEMGGALVIFSVGVLAFGISIKLLQAIFKNDLLMAGAIAGSIIVGFGLAFAVIGAGPIGVAVAAGAAAMITVGVALISISVGILAFALAIKALQALFTDLNTAGETAGKILLGLGLAFSALGLMSPLIMFGSVAAVALSASLIGVSVGLLAFGLSLKLLDSAGILVKDGDSYTIKGLSIITQIASEISKVGLYSLNPFFWMGMATSAGIGGSLVMIGAGLSAAGAALKEASPDTLSRITSGIFGDGGLVPVLAEQFAKIGKKYGGGFLSSFLGTDDVSVGIRVTRGFGDVLKDLAGGIVAFSRFSEFPVKVPNPKDPSNLVYTTVDMFGEVIPKLNENLPSLLSVLAETFSTIGQLYGGDGGWFGKDSPVQKGIDAVRGLGGVLSEVAGGIVAFSQFEEFPVQVPNPKDPSKLIYKTINLFDTLPKIKDALIGSGTVQGKLTPKTGILLGLAEVFAEIGNKYGDEGFFSDGAVKQGVDAVKGIGGVISELAQGIIAFATMERGLPNYDQKGKFNGTYTKFRMEDVQANITKVLKILPSVFAGIDLKSMEDAKDKAKLIAPLAESISRIGKALGDLMVDKKKGDQVNLLDTMGPSLKKFIDSAKDISADKMMISQLNSLAGVLEKFARSSDGLKNFAESLVSSGQAFKSFSSGFGTFSSQIDKFAKFESSFSNLIKNQSYYKFDQFAKSMGTMKENVNAFNVENLKLTDSMMKSLAILSKSPDATGEKIKESIDEAMKQLVDAIKKISGTSEQQAGAIDKLSQTLGTSSMFGESKPAAQTVAVPGPKSAAPEQQGPDINVQLLAAINSLSSKLSALSSMQFKGGALIVTDQASG